MTEKEKMLGGMPYDTTDAELRQISSRGKNLMRVYNAVPAEDGELRQLLVKELFGSVGENVRVNQPIYVDYGKNVCLGNNVLVNMNTTLMDTGRITIEDNVMMGPDVKIYTAVHDMDGEKRFFTDAKGVERIITWTKPVTIKSYTWIGGGVVLLPGVTIGRNAVIGAGSVVKDDIPDNAVACGNPCTVKYIKNC